jgi:hypothetical protein
MKKNKRTQNQSPVCSRDLRSVDTAIVHFFFLVVLSVSPRYNLQKSSFLLHLSIRRLLVAVDRHV